MMIKENLKSAILKVSPKQREKIIRIKGFINNKGIKNYNKIIKNDMMIKENFKYLGSNEISSWKNSFKKYIMSEPKKIEIANEFFKCNFEVCSTNKSEISVNAPILICIVKNDLNRIKLLYEHYRELGVEKFVVLDNDSNDGTKEWLLKQVDTDLYSTKEKFTTSKKQGWINKLISIYGLERWYLLVDSDELLVYDDCENKKIDELIKRLKEKGITRVRALMIDMYSNNKLFDEEEEDMKMIKSKYSYFDSNSYLITPSLQCECVVGGVRSRVFGASDETFKPHLTKYPLIFFREGDIQCDPHFSFPYYKNFGEDCYLALLHYKFLSKDLEKYKKIALDGSYAQGSKEYKKYIEIYTNNRECRLKNNESKQYENSSSLNEINIIKSVFKS